MTELRIKGSSQRVNMYKLFFFGNCILCDVLSRLNHFQIDQGLLNQMALVGKSKGEVSANTPES